MRAITAVSFNAGYKDDTLNVYGSVDGEEWTLIEAVSITSTYNDYSVSFTDEVIAAKYTYIKLDVAGTNQVRVANLTLTLAPMDKHVCDSNTVIDAVAATCTESGMSAGTKCSVCGIVMSGCEVIDALGHDESDSWTSDDLGHWHICENDGCTETFEYAVHSDDDEDGICDICEAVIPTVESTVTYTFSDYTAGTQYAAAEEHVLDSNLTVTVDDGHFTTQLRLYDNSSNDSTAVFASEMVIDSLVINAGNSAATLNVYGSTDGETWVEITSLTTTKAYADHTVDISVYEYTYIKLDAVGAQIRIPYITFNYAV